jgi:hypothetical protein
VVAPREVTSERPRYAGSDDSVGRGCSRIDRGEILRRIAVCSKRIVPSARENESVGFRFEALSADLSPHCICARVVSHEDGRDHHATLTVDVPETLSLNGIPERQFSRELVVRALRLAAFEMTPRRRNPI